MGSGVYAREGIDRGTRTPRSIRKYLLPNLKPSPVTLAGRIDM
jgi:hypothetical protein